MITIGDAYFRGLKWISRLTDQIRRYTRHYHFIKRSNNLKKLLIVVAGYQDYVWEIVFDRIKKTVSKDIDVCIVVPGKESNELQKICNENQWSYLSTKQNKLALAQNMAIKLHPNAEWIYKLDEDIFVGDGYFDNLLQTFLKAESEQIYQVGVVAPALNINGSSYRYVLEKLGGLSGYLEKFGSARITCDNDPIYKSSEAANYMWELSLPIDEKIYEFSKEQVSYFSVPIRLSIGAFLIRRELWEDMKGFKVAAAGQLAWEEMCMCDFCMNYSRTILIAGNVFAGHFGFGGQKKGVIPLFESRRKDFVYHKLEE